MATQDNNIQYDLLFLNQFYDYAYGHKPASHREYYTETLLNGEIQISTFLENVVAKVGGHQRSSKQAFDLDDGSEVKGAVSSYRNNNIRKGAWMHTYEVKNVHTKTGPIRFVGFNKIVKEFEYYFIPNHAFCHLKKNLTLPIETFSGYYASPKFTGIRTSDSVWHQYMISDFETMCKLK